MDVKNEVLYRVYGLLFGIVLPIAIVLIYKTVDISYWNGERWREKGKDQYMDFRPVEAERGNILAVDGSLLATSIPFFDIYMDPNSTGMSEEDFMENLDTLAWCIAQHIDNTFTPGGFREYLLQQRQDKQRYLPIKRKASYAEKRFIEQFPLFNLGQMRGGFIAQKRSERKRPFGVLAQRTIGYVRDDAKPIGLEGYFDRDLGGHQGQQLMICVDRPNDIWIPVHDLMQVEPRSGDDIVTTLDINLQDVVHNALLRALNYHDAEWGTAVLMETQTGAIRAIANLGRIDNGWWETFNYAVGYPIEPGSTFKLASIMALLEDKYIDLDDTIAIDRGRATFYDEEMNDSSPYTARMDTASVRDIFRYSSNVGMAKLVSKYYGKKEKRNGDEGAARFVRRLKDFHLNLPTGIEIEGEVNPYIKEAYNTQDQWSGTTLPWMSIGYEVKMTPLQLLTFYNAVANNGALVKPYLVSEVLRFGEPIRSYKPTILKKSIAERTTIRKAQTLLESVVEEGTAYKLRTERFRIAGKTGTTQVNYRRGQRGRSVGGYQASFVGYFPAERPRYSCIVIISEPQRGGYYGADVAGPVFREIADQVFSMQLEFHPSFNERPKPPLAAAALPGPAIGEKEDLQTALRFLRLPTHGEPAAAEWLRLEAREDSLFLRDVSYARGIVPSVVGMGLRDAVYLLENLGLQVRVTGVGKVRQQSLTPGARARGQVIQLLLN